MAKIHVPSSWRNKYQPEVVKALSEAGHAIYDFRNPEHNPGGFHWSDEDGKSACKGAILPTQWGFNVIWCAIPGFRSQKGLFTCHTLDKTNAPSDCM